MSAILRSWVAFAAVGAGLVHLALVIGAPTALGVVLGMLGLAEFAWGVLTFARETVPLPRIALVVAILAPLLWAVLLLTGVGDLGLVPLGVTSLLELFVAAMLGRRLRQGSGTAAPPSVGRYVLSLAAGALVVVALVAPALTATEVGSVGDPGGVLDLSPHGH